MSTNSIYADYLRSGERTRDASDKAAGFLYQDLVAIDLILKGSDQDKVYLEWVEDIYIENDTNIKIVQVKHYPKTSVDFKEIYKELFYQFLRFELYLKKEGVKKKIETYCIKYSDNSCNLDKCKDSIIIKQTENLKDIDIDSILDEFYKKENKKDRIEFIINNVANDKLLRNFIFKEKDEGSIEQLSSRLKRKILNEFEEQLKSIGLYSEESIDDILLAMAIHTVQNSYIKENSKCDKSEERYLTKLTLLSKLNNICNIDCASYLERIKMRIFSYIEECYEEILEVPKSEVLDIYFKIYISTKEYIYNSFTEKKNRFRFLNTISTDEYKVLNWNLYNKLSFEEEKDIILEHKESIKLFFMYIWKILFDIECTQFNKYIIEAEEALFFKFPQEKVDFVIVVTQMGRKTKCASNILSRVLKMSPRPKKWYLSGVKGTYEYPYNVNRISENKLGSKFSVAYTDEKTFSIECMNCVKIDEDDMNKKELELSCSLFEFDCIEEKE